MKYLPFGKRLILTVVLFFICKGLFAQKSLENAFQKLYDSTILKSDKYSFLLDTTFPASTIKYDNFYSDVRAKDTSLLREIIENGNVVDLTPQQIFDYLDGRLPMINLPDFKKIRVQGYKLNKCEQDVLKELNEAMDKWVKIPDSDTIRMKKMGLVIRDLQNSKCFKSYSKKQAFSIKRALIFYPVMKWKDHFLIAYISYHSMTNGNFIVKIL